MHFLHSSLFSRVSLLSLIALQVGQTNGGVVTVETVTIAGKPFTVNPTDIVIESQTIAPTHAPVTIESATISVDKSYDIFVDGSKVISGPGAAQETTSSSVTSSSSKSASGSTGTQQTTSSTHGTGSLSSVSSSASDSTNSGTSLATGSQQTTSTATRGTGSASGASSGASDSTKSGTSLATGSQQTTSTAKGTGSASGASSGASDSTKTGTSLATGSQQTASTATKGTGSASGASSGASGAASSSGASSSSPPFPSSATGSATGQSTASGSTGQSGAGTQSSSLGGTGATRSTGQSTGSGTASTGTNTVSLGTGASRSTGLSSASGTLSSKTSGVPFGTGASGSSSRSSLLGTGGSSSSTFRNPTSPITTGTKSSPAPGSTGSTSAASATSGSSSGSLATSGTFKSSASTSPALTNVPNPTQPGGITLASFATAGSAASSQHSAFGAILLGFVAGGRGWVSDITLPAIKTQAIDEINNLKDDTENLIKNLGGTFPPSVHPCSGGSSKKRFFNPIGAVENLAKDALSLAGCVDDIVNDITNEIGPLTGPPPGADVISEISTQLDALEKAGEEEQNEDNQSQSDGESKTSDKQTSDSKTSDSKTSDSTSRSSSTVSSSSTGTKTSSSSSSTSATSTGCAGYTYPDDDIEEWEGPPVDGNLFRRKIGSKSRLGQMSRRTSNTHDNPDGRYDLVKRVQAAAITGINTCTFPGGQLGVQPGYSGLNAFRNLGRQRGGNGGQAGAVYDACPKWYVGQHDCTSTDGFRWYLAPEGPDDIPAGSRQSVDHVYEKQLVSKFLQTRIGQAGFTCTDMETVFFPCGQNLIQTVFNQLPGMQFSDQLNNNPPLYKSTNPGFAGLEQSINGVKGYLFDEGVIPASNFFQRARINAGNTAQIGTIQDFIMLFDIMRDPEFKNMFDVTNDRIYKAYQTIDQAITTNHYMKSDGSGPIAADWADSYKTWMTNYLGSIAGPAWTWSSNTVDNLENLLNPNTDDDPVIAAQLNQLEKIKNSPDFSQAKFTIDMGLTWSTGTLKARDLEVRDAASSGAACAYTRSGSSSASSTKSGTSSETSKITSGGSSGFTTVSKSASASASVTASGPTSTTSKAGSTSGPASTTAKPTNTPQCMADGAPWYSPTSWCDCGASARLPALPVASGITGEDSSSAMCTYTTIDPAKTINPVSTSAAPSNIPGEGGLDACRGTVWSPGADCPYAEWGYCNCNGYFVPSLSQDNSSINCDYKLQPTANDCPVVTAFSSSLAAASASSASVASASAASVASVISVSQAAAASASAAAAPKGNKYSIFLVYNIYTDGGGYPITEDFWKVWSSENTNDTPDFCSGTNRILSTEVPSGIDTGTVFWPIGPLKFTVGQAGKRNCQWDPISSNGQGQLGPGTLTCDSPGPNDSPCVDLPQVMQECGSAQNRIIPLAQCSWQDQN